MCGLFAVCHSSITFIRSCLFRLGNLLIFEWCTVTINASVIGHVWLLWNVLRVLLFFVNVAPPRAQCWVSLANEYCQYMPGLQREKGAFVQMGPDHVIAYRGSKVSILLQWNFVQILAASLFKGIFYHKGHCYALISKLNIYSNIRGHMFLLFISLQTNIC